MAVHGIESLVADNGNQYAIGRATIGRDPT